MALRSDQIKKPAMWRSSSTPVILLFAGIAAYWFGVIRGVAAETPAAADTAGVKYFNEQVLQLLQKNCFQCHSHAAGKASGGLVLDSRSGWSKGGDSGPAVVAGKPNDSLLIQAVRYGDLEMPPSGKLPADAIAKLEHWVDQGAIDPRTAETVQAASTIDHDAGRKHWAFQPLGNPAPPTVKNAAWPKADIDRFLLARLEAGGLQPAADADRSTWLRRVSLDLTGLPPKPDEIAAFLADNSPQAYEHVVDRLLASRGFGERWGRHWLDLVGYADQVGIDNNIPAHHAWRYRDYVIDAFNQDKSYLDFTREQLAGDLLPYQTTEERAAHLVATGFLLFGELLITEADKAKLRVDVVDQQVDKIGRAFLGLTIGCARCHDHKFDPVSQREYYALAGILNSTESVHKIRIGVWSSPTEIELPETESEKAERQARAEAHRQKIEALKATRARLQTQQSEIDAALKQAAGSKPADDAQRAIRAALDKVRVDLTERLKANEDEILHAEFVAPAPAKAYAVRDIADPADMRITIRGNAHALGSQVPRGFVQVAIKQSAPQISAGQSGRRQLADWIASVDNPLTARVAVNRVWQKLFGEGLVRSVDYFGLAGERPSNPELLDHLAGRFIAGNWSQKRFIRALVLSHAYRISSRADARLLAADPDNRLFGRMNRRRLDAEALRDSLLAVSGKLIESAGGPSLPLEFVENVGNLKPGGVNPPSFRLGRFRPEQPFVRTIYLPIIRLGLQVGPSELRNVFDFTQPADFAGQRPTTAVPTQALFLLNSKLMNDRAHDLAELILAHSSDDRTRLEQLWIRVYGRPILDTERAEAASFLAAGRSAAPAEKTNSDKTNAADTDAWTELCHALLASNEFLMRM